MPAPTNISPATAYQITVVPFTQTLSAATVELAPTGTGYPSTCDSTQRRALWWMFTTGPDDRLLALSVAPNDLIGPGPYNPNVSIWTGSPLAQFVTTNGDPNNFCDDLFANYFNIPVRPNTTYYFLVTDKDNTTPLGTGLTITLSAAPILPVPVGSLLISDDSDGFPAALLSATDGSFLRYVDYPAGEVSDWLPSGVQCVQNGEANTSVAILSPALQTVTTHSVSPNSVFGIRSDKTDTFYVMHKTGADPMSVVALNASGVAGSTWTLPSDSASAFFFAVARDGSILYYGGSTVNTPIHAYDLTNSMALADLHAGFTGETLFGNGDGFVAADGTIWFGYKSATPKMRQFNSSGTVLQTITLNGSPATGTANHYADDPDGLHFWYWVNPVGSYFRKFVMSTGATALTTGIIPTNGTSGGPMPDEFSISNSCPLLVIPTALLTPPAPGGQGNIGYETRTLIEPRIRVAPHITSELLREFITKFQIHLQAGIGQGNGQGANPVVMFSFSTNGGRTWSNERLLPAGRVGEFTRRCITWRLGQGRDWVFRVSVTDPNVPWALVAAYLDAEAGDS